MVEEDGVLRVPSNADGYREYPSVCNNLLHSMIKSCNIYLNQHLITKDSNDYNYRFNLYENKTGNNLLLFDCFLGHTSKPLLVLGNKHRRAGLQVRAGPKINL